MTPSKVKCTRKVELGSISSQTSSQASCCFSSNHTTLLSVATTTTTTTYQLISSCELLLVFSPITLSLKLCSTNSKLVHTTFSHQIYLATLKELDQMEMALSLIIDKLASSFSSFNLYISYFTRSW